MRRTVERHNDALPYRTAILCCVSRVRSLHLKVLKVLTLERLKKLVFQAGAYPLSLPYNSDLRAVYQRA